MKVELTLMQSTYAINENRPKRVLAKNTNAEDEFWDRDVNTRYAPCIASTTAIVRDRRHVGTW
ncbi:hypothetical protein RMSM_01380 [Rhodopirellula maiorica SM1]|uniref:Uncharacterized protein n=1 Tax=Rhodopirellula maiorica SM1 TaxID=1265738 RepID=M5RQR6_9BACT|nr:hypothetical protein RMSM_01380 [Rhodopirellula maiorica SM1]